MSLQHHQLYSPRSRVQCSLLQDEAGQVHSSQLKSKRSTSLFASRASIKHMGLLLWSCISCLLRSGSGQSAVGSIVCQWACLCSKLVKTDMKLARLVSEVPWTSALTTLFASFIHSKGGSSSTRGSFEPIPPTFSCLELIASRPPIWKAFV